MAASTDYASDTQGAHQTFHGAAGDGNALALKLSPDLPGAIHTKLCHMDLPDLLPQHRISYLTCRWLTLTAGVVR